jgi:hypothetical protein
MRVETPAGAPRLPPRETDIIMIRFTDRPWMLDRGCGSKALVSRTAGGLAV